MSKDNHSINQDQAKSNWAKSVRCSIRKQSLKKLTKTLPPGSAVKRIGGIWVSA